MNQEPSSPSEDDLLRSAQAGDALSFGLWIERQYDFIYRLAYRLLGHKMDAEDLTHDICLSLPDKLRKFSGRGSARGWLAQVVLNAGRDRLRQRGRLATSLLNEEISASSNDNPAEAVYLQQVLTVMKSLPEKSCHALLLAAEGLSTAEMATALQCSEGTVGWRVSTARAELTKRLTEERHAATR